MKVMITGAEGLLGQKLAISFAQETSAEILLTDLSAQSFFHNPRFDYQQLDITKRGDVKSLISNFHPDVIINTAALTDVDVCETDREYAWRVNVDGLKNLLIPARRVEGCHVIHISTDYVFSGQSAPYSETSRPEPISYYGKSKLASENALTESGVHGTIVRTQLLYGTGFRIRKNFVAWVLSMLESEKQFQVVDDQTGNPTHVDDLAYAIVKIAEKKRSGLYHISGPEALNRFAFAQRIADIFGFHKKLITSVKSFEIGQAANRPQDSTFLTLKYQAEFGYRFSNVDRGLQHLALLYKDGANHVGLLEDARFLT